MEALDLTVFLNAENLKTLPGQLAGIVILTQMFREFRTGDYLKVVAVLSGLWLQAVVNFLDGVFLTATLVAINGSIVALAAMMTAERLKGKSEKLPIELKPAMIVVNRPDPLREERKNGTAGKP